MSDWTVESALRQIREGEPLSDLTESAADWLYTTIQREATAPHPLMTGTIAEMVLDALIEEVKEHG